MRRAGPGEWVGTGVGRSAQWGRSPDPPKGPVEDPKGLVEDPKGLLPVEDPEGLAEDPKGLAGGSKGSVFVPFSSFRSGESEASSATEATAVPSFLAASATIRLMTFQWLLYADESG